jgi:NAD(P)H dehydrogenase (quinone)
MILVTAATGTVGSLVVRGLQERQADVRPFSRTTGGDFERPETIGAALIGVEDVFLATPNHPHQAEHEANVIDAAVAAGVRRVVKLSAAGAAIGSPLAFWDAHGRSEAYLRDSGLDHAILRPTAFTTHLVPGTAARVTAIDPADVAAAAVALLTERWTPGVHELAGTKEIGIDPFPVAGLPDWVAGNLTTLFELLKTNGRPRDVAAAGR